MTIPVISPIPEVPNRATQGEEFSDSVDLFFTAFPVFRAEMNASIAAINDAVVSITAIGEAAGLAADRAEAAAAFKAAIAFKTWAQLSALSGTYVGQSAAVFDDAGSHTDPVVGGTVDNEGIYRWSTAPAGWEWVSDGAGSSVAWGDITGKPSTFAPSAHSHVISDVTGLEAALTAKAATGAIGSSGLTMTTSRLLGRVAGGAGAVQEISLGEGLSFDGTTLKYTGSTDMVYPGAGIAVSTGSGWGASLAAPSGSLVGTSASQTLTNKTLGSGTTISDGTITAGPNVSDSGSITANSVGFRGTPRQSAGSRTLALSDNGKLLSLSSTATIPSGLPIGFACTIYNNSSSSSSIVQGSGVTLRFAGSASTGTRTLASRGVCSVLVVNTNEVVVAGNLS